MDPIDFITIAKEVVKFETPASYRTAFGRAYYAVYNSCFNLLTSAGVKISSGSSGHGEVQRYLGNCGITELKKAQQNLANLHTDRIKADYHLRDKVVEKRANAEKAIIRSEKVVEIIKSFSSEHELKKIYDGVQEYNDTISMARKS